MGEYKIIENELVPVYETDKGEKIVDGRELHAVLQSKQDFSTWVKRRLNECDAEENKDYSRFHRKMEANNATMIEYIIRLDTAKEMAMLERNDKGKQVRRYFIQVEERYKEDLRGRIEDRQAGTPIRLYKNNKWYILTIGDEVYNLAPDEAKIISKAVSAMLKNGVAQIEGVVRTMVESFNRDCELKCARECIVGIDKAALEDKARGKGGDKNE